MDNNTMPNPTPATSNMPNIPEAPVVTPNVPVAGAMGTDLSGTGMPIGGATATDAGATGLPPVYNAGYDSTGMAAGAGMEATGMSGASMGAANPATMATPGIGMDAGIGAAPAADGAMAGGAVPGVPTFDPTMMDFGATDPLTVPEGPKAPDPVEEELKMPLRAADPVPGSIGSAVSMPAGQAAAVDPAMAGAGMQQTPSVAFNDPATMQSAPAANPAAAKPAKKINKTTLILAGVLGVVVIIALIVILIVVMQ